MKKRESKGKFLNPKNLLIGFVVIIIFLLILNYFYPLLNIINQNDGAGELYQLFPVEPIPLGGSPEYNDKDILKCSVKIIIECPNDGVSKISGTIIDTRDGFGLISTVGHAFRDHIDTGNSGELKDGCKIKIDPQWDNNENTIPGKLRHCNLNDDVGFVSIPLPPGAQKCPLASKDFEYKVGMKLIKAGCPEGHACTIRTVSITHINRYLGQPNIEISPAQKEGESGGGVFDENGNLVCIMYASDYEDNEGLCTPLSGIMDNLKACGLDKIIGVK